MNVYGGSGGCRITEGAQPGLQSVREGGAVLCVVGAQPDDRAVGEIILSGDPVRQLLQQRGGLDVRQPCGPSLRAAGAENAQRPVRVGAGAAQLGRAGGKLADADDGGDTVAYTAEERLGHP